MASFDQCIKWRIFSSRGYGFHRLPDKPPAPFKSNGDEIIPGDFKRIHQMLPRCKNQTPEDGARDIEGAMDWMRNIGVKPDEDFLPPKFEKLNSVPTSKRTPEQRVKDVDDVMNWMRNGKPEKEDPTGDFERIDQLLPQRKNHTPEDRTRDIEGALDWCRNKGVKPPSDEDSPHFTKIGSVGCEAVCIGLFV